MGENNTWRGNWEADGDKFSGIYLKHTTPSAMKKQNWDIYQMRKGGHFGEIFYMCRTIAAGKSVFSNSNFEKFGNFGPEFGIVSADTQLDGIWDLLRQVQFWRRGMGENNTWRGNWEADGDKFSGIFGIAEALTR